jgi:hypothetical protein
MADRPEWNAPGAIPPQSKKDQGWQEEEKPPAGWFNWLFNRTYESLIEHDNIFTDIQNGDFDVAVSNEAGTEKYKLVIVDGSLALEELA